jgi:3-deoxy-D-manno-octulosonic-acid transferase
VRGLAIYAFILCASTIFLNKKMHHFCAFLWRFKPILTCSQCELSLTYTSLKKYFFVVVFDLPVALLCYLARLAIRTRLNICENGGMSAFLYSCLLYLALPFVPFKLLWRSIKQPAYLKHWPERIGFYNIRPQLPIIWLHCVSVGETRAAVPLIQALLAEYPHYQILLTHTTPTGREASQHLFGDKVLRAYLPYDLPFAVKRFLNHFQPNIGMLMETELWFNLIAACKQQQTPLLLINGRLSEKSAEGYAKLGHLSRSGFRNLSAVAAQTNADAVRMQSLGAPNIMVTGNMKYDVHPPSDAVAKGLHLRQTLWQDRLIFVAASTRKGEEKHIINAIKGLDLLTIIVPRHPERFNEVEALLLKSGVHYQRRSNLVGPIDPSINVILGDSMGEMFTYYAACDFALVGGSLLKYGGQNLIEPAYMGKPILIGLHTFNFAQAADAAIEYQAAIRIKSGADLREKIQYLMQNASLRKKMGKAAVKFSRSETGATKKILKLISEHIAPASSV